MKRKIACARARDYCFFYLTTVDLRFVLENRFISPYISRLNFNQLGQRCNESTLNDGKTACTHRPTAECDQINEIDDASKAVNGNIFTDSLSDAWCE